jgi:SAM-dependent methyltransferase
MDGQRLEGIQLRRNDEAFLDGLGAQRIPDPTTSGDFTRRFDQEAMMDEAINSTRQRVWKKRAKEAPRACLEKVNLLSTRILSFMNDTTLQRAYYARTASLYDEAHLSAAEPEHDFALDLLSGIARAAGYRSFLDVGSGTGRGIARLQREFPQAEIVGIEPVAELREVGHRKGIAPSCLVDGDATGLNFPNESFDCVFALGVMHHLPNPRRAISEMSRVSRKAIFISDGNNLSCGSIYQRVICHSLTALRLWRSFQFVKNGFKPWKFNEGDGIHYSYSLLNEMTFLRSLGLTLFLFTTRPTGRNPSWTCSHVAIFATKVLKPSL